ncbi:hypothetical protein ACHAW5_000677 [Stephanodiscus triporus]|uniref:P-type Ca(2+) transporter n=1 Tax=Stephanodiscus triporus TaxID=2934178 RepID=A0ABD3NWH6_9STRA
MVEELKSDSVDDATNVSSVGPLEVASGNANANGDSTPNRGPPQRPGLAELVASSMRSLGSVGSAIVHAVFTKYDSALDAPFAITPKDLGDLSSERTHWAMGLLLDKALKNLPPTLPGQEESLQIDKAQIQALVKRIGTEEGELDERHLKSSAHMHDMDLAANALATVILRSKPEEGITNEKSDIDFRRESFGTNAITPKELDSFLKLCWEAVQDFVLIMLICLGIIDIVVETTIGLKEGETCGHCWFEGAAILGAVFLVVLVSATIDYQKQFIFVRLSRSLYETNTKMVIRDGRQLSVIDDEIVVGDILSVNAHNLASIPADCVVLGPPVNGGIKMDESSLTGESVLITKNPGDVVLSGTTVVQGSGKLLVIAVGINSVAGKIKARVYEATEHADGDGLDGDAKSPLFVKLEALAKKIGMAGTAAALLSLVVNCIRGFAIQKQAVGDVLIEYIVVAITVLAVAVPEGLPLAVTLALAFSSNKMMKDQNLVKTLDACETMGSATTICTDKTGTLTTNKMTARAMYTNGTDFSCTDPAVALSDFVKTNKDCPNEQTLDLVSKLIAINTMDETTVDIDPDGKIISSTGNPTEVALLLLASTIGGTTYQEIRETTRGRSDKGALSEFLVEGKQFQFTSARKMMSWAVPLIQGGYRIYCKGASEVLLARCNHQFANDVVELNDASRQGILRVGEMYARRGMRTLALAYRDLPDGVDFEAKSDSVLNADGSEANAVETNLTFVALVGIEDPLRPEVPEAIEKCYEAGIDVRMVTGDAPNTAVSIAYQAGILKDFHFAHGTDEKIAINLKPNVLMEGKIFRRKVYRIDENGNKEFDQTAFDKIWPHLRVMARSSPDDKLTLAHGLNQSTLYTDKSACEQLKKEDNISVFPDRQVVAMTGDGTNDAPALKRADIGFAMGIAGTQIAKDAADIILLDDNFASIVTAAKWGRNVYASIQKFLQFQLTVNIAAVVTALVGSFAYAKSPLAAIQLLWVNLIMDALASLALASEPPTDELLKNDPVNRSKSIVTSQMWGNMLGHAAYQLAVIFFLLFEGPGVFGFEPGHIVERELKENSTHYTFIFNSFVWMQLFNEFNARALNGEFNVFKGVLSNPLFCVILFISAVLQVIMVQFGGDAMHVHEDGLDGELWGYSIAIGAGSLPMGQVINVVYYLFHSCCGKKEAS